MIVVKIGGGQGINLAGVAEDLAGLMAEEQEQFVVVHGGSAETTMLAAQLNHNLQHLTSASGMMGRYHDPKTMEVFIMATAGKVNKQLVEQLQSFDVNAFGLSGVDGGLFRGHRLDESTYLDEQGQAVTMPRDFTGRLDDVNADLLNMLLDHGYTPVVTPIALSEENETIYIDADRAAANIAAALGATTYVVLCTVPGLLKDPSDPSTLIRQLEVDQFDSFVEEFARGRMKRKMAATLEALQGDVRHIIISDGREKHPIRRALEGFGTVIKADDSTGF
jgi:acetylglutamate/LysW-gamma-L-alpha-aminoadipate kinase